MTTGTQIPLVMTASGPVPTPPVTLLAQLIALVMASNPGYTVLPSGLIDDISGTDVAALSLNDQARVDAVSSVTPFGANPYILTQLGQQFGIPQGVGTNTAVDIVFSTPTSGAGSAIGYVIPAGFTVSDGTYQYVAQEGTILQSGGSSGTVTAVATQSGSWAVPADTVNQIVTSVPSPYTITVTNPQAGTPAQAAETIEDYQSRVLQAGLAAATGTLPYLKTLLDSVTGVVPRLVSVQQAATGWKVIVGGGDVYSVAYAIYLGLTDISRLVGSVTPDRNVSATIFDNPDSYTVIFVDPPAQIVTATVTWNTTLANFTAGAQVNSLAAPALVNYINSIQVTQPINELAMTAAFQEAVATVISSLNITTLTFTVYINGIETAPSAGTSIIPGDPESYFSAAQNAITVQQG